jgi:hypothetical protein
MGNSTRYHIDYTSIFPSYPYDEKFVEAVKPILAKHGCTHFKMDNLHGWNNQPKVLCFEMADASIQHRAHIESEIELMIDRWPVCIRPKNWKY